MDDSLVKFKYEVKIGQMSGFLKELKNSGKIPKLEEIAIYSEEFNSYKSCQESLNGLMLYLSTAEGQASKKNQVLVSKIHPNLDTSERKHADVSTWDDFTLIRAYVANAERLKHSELEFHIMGQIVADHEIEVACQVDA